jgi:hypothetical protein
MDDVGDIVEVYAASVFRVGGCRLVSFYITLCCEKEREKGEVE